MDVGHDVTFLAVTKFDINILITGWQSKYWQSNVPNYASVVALLEWLKNARV